MLQMTSSVANDKTVYLIQAVNITDKNSNGILGLVSNKQTETKLVAWMFYSGKVFMHMGISFENVKVISREDFYYVEFKEHLF